MARNESFEAVVNKIASMLLAARAGSRSLTVEEAKTTAHDGVSVQALLNGALTTLGEVWLVTRAAFPSHGCRTSCCGARRGCSALEGRWAATCMPLAATVR